MCEEDWENVSLSLINVSTFWGSHSFVTNGWAPSGGNVAGLATQCWSQECVCCCPPVPPLCFHGMHSNTENWVLWAADFLTFRFQLMNPWRNIEMLCGWVFGCLLFGCVAGCPLVTMIFFSLPPPPTNPCPTFFQRAPPSSTSGALFHEGHTQNAHQT